MTIEQELPLLLDELAQPCCGRPAPTGRCRRRRACRSVALVGSVAVGRSAVCIAVTIVGLIALAVARVIVRPRTGLRRSDASVCVGGVSLASGHPAVPVRRGCDR